MREARALRTSVLRHPPGHIQRTAAYFLSMGHYDAQIRKMSAALQARREAMQQAIDAAGLHVAGMGAFGGSSFWMQAPRDVDTDDRAKALEARSALIEPGHAFFAGDAPQWDMPSFFRPEGHTQIAARFYKTIAAGDAAD